MNKNFKTFAMLIGFAILLCSAVFAYNSLSKDVVPEGVDVLFGDEDKDSVKTEDTPSSTSDGENEDSDATSSEEDKKVIAPDFTVFDMEGNEVSLSSMLGAPVVVNFWASWCPPCKAEMPDFETVYKELGGEVMFMMINLTDSERETKKNAEDYIAEQGFTFPVYLDTTQTAAYTYGISSIPTTLFIDEEGYVAAGVQGAINEATLRKGIGLIYEQ